MVEDLAITLSKEGLLLIIIISAPPVIASLVVGLSISLFQATTQIQDQSLTFVPKLVAVLLVLVLFGNWAAGHIINFAAELLGNFHTFIK